MITKQKFCELLYIQYPKHLDDDHFNQNHVTPLITQLRAIYTSPEVAALDMNETLPNAVLVLIRQLITQAKKHYRENSATEMVRSAFERILWPNLNTLQIDLLGHVFDFLECKQRTLMAVVSQRMRSAVAELAPKKELMSIPAPFNSPTDYGCFLPSGILITVRGSKYCVYNCQESTRLLWQGTASGNIIHYFAVEYSNFIAIVYQGQKHYKHNNHAPLLYGAWPPAFTEDDDKSYVMIFDPMSQTMIANFAVPDLAGYTTFKYIADNRIIMVPFKKSLFGDTHVILIYDFSGNEVDALYSYGASHAVLPGNKLVYVSHEQPMGITVYDLSSNTREFSPLPGITTPEFFNFNRMWLLPGNRLMTIRNKKIVSGFLITDEKRSELAIIDMTNWTVSQVNDFPNNNNRALLSNHDIEIFTTPDLRTYIAYRSTPVKGVKHQEESIEIVELDNGKVIQALSGNDVLDFSWQTDGVFVVKAFTEDKSDIFYKYYFPETCMQEALTHSKAQPLDYPILESVEEKKLEIKTEIFEDAPRYSR